MAVIMRDVSRRMKRLFRWRDPNRFLELATGVVHVGANVGQERNLYLRNGLNVIWIEPIPEVFAQLEQNLHQLPQQKAFNALITDRDDATYPFRVASNNGASSSILDLGLHKDIWPHVEYNRTIELRSVTLTTFLRAVDADPKTHDALVLDTQGSELLVLQGAIDILSRFRFVKTEVPDFEAYAGCCRLDEVDQFMIAQGFTQFSRHEFAVRAKGGSYYDVVYQRHP